MNNEYENTIFSKCKLLTDSLCGTELSLTSMICRLRTRSKRDKKFSGTLSFSSTFTTLPSLAVGLSAFRLHLSTTRQTHKWCILLRIGHVDFSLYFLIADVLHFHADPARLAASVAFEADESLLACAAADTRHGAKGRIVDVTRGFNAVLATRIYFVRRTRMAVGGG